MAEFNEEDLRPFSSASRPRTSAPGPRPATGLRPKTGYRQQSGVAAAGSRMGTAMGARVEWSVELGESDALLEVPLTFAESKSQITFINFPRSLFRNWTFDL